MGVLIFIGFLLIIYAGLIFVYRQQDAVQADLQIQIDRTAAIVAKELSNPSQMEEEYQDVQEKLKPLTRDEAIALLVAVAAKHGVEIDPEAGKLVIPPTSIKIGPGKVGGGSYQVMSFGKISVKSSYANVMALISDLDAGATKETMVLTSFDILSPEGEEEAGAAAVQFARAAERSRVQMAVTAMMTANKLTTIPNPIDYAGGEASNDMAAFPDPTSGWLGSSGDKTVDAGGISYRSGDADGYVLYDHDDRADGSTGGLFDYMDGLARTTYFYTCEADGTVRQFLSADLSGDLSGEELPAAQIEVDVILSVDIYSLEPEEEE